MFVADPTRPGDQCAAPVQVRFGRRLVQHEPVPVGNSAQPDTAADAFANAEAHPAANATPDADPDAPAHACPHPTADAEPDAESNADPRSTSNAGPHATSYTHPDVTMGNTAGYPATNKCLLGSANNRETHTRANARTDQHPPDGDPSACPSFASAAPVYARFVREGRHVYLHLTCTNQGPC